MATYWASDLPDIKGYSGHLWRSILIFANIAHLIWMIQQAYKIGRFTAFATFTSSFVHLSIYCTCRKRKMTVIIEQNYNPEVVTMLLSQFPTFVVQMDPWYMYRGRFREWGGLGGYPF